MFASGKLNEKVIIALDFDCFSDVKKLVKQLKDEAVFFKVGKQLFTMCGPDAVRFLKDEGYKVFLDLKFHDIPNTVAKAAVEACKLGADIINIHASGGLAMMKSAVEAVREFSLSGSFQPPKIIGVTVLTSLDNSSLKEIGFKCGVKNSVKRLALLAKKGGLDGVVASPLEIKMIRKICGKDFLIVTPGIRPASSLVNDQKRIMTPKEAIKEGADFLVIGRPVIRAKNPLEALLSIINEMK